MILGKSGERREGRVWSARVFSKVKTCVPPVPIPAPLAAWCSLPSPLAPFPLRQLGFGGDLVNQFLARHGTF